MTVVIAVASCGTGQIFGPICFDQPKGQKPQFRGQGLMCVGSHRGPVCEDGSPLPFLEAKPRSEVPASIPADAGLSAVERKIAADEVASRALFLRRSQVLLLTRSSFHG